MAYQWLTFSAARQQLAARLADASNAFWRDAENGAYIVEALRVWNALTWTWKASFTFTIAAASAPVWSSLGLLTGSPRLRGLTDTALYTLMEYHLLEPATGGTWTGTSQFSIADLSAALQRCRDEAIQVSNCNQVNPALIRAVPGSETVTLADTYLDVARARFVAVYGVSQEYVLPAGTGGPTLSNRCSVTYIAPVAMLGASAPGDVFTGFSIPLNSPVTTLLLSFYGSSFNLISSTNITAATSGVVVTAPAGTTQFTVRASNAVAFAEISLAFVLNGNTYTYTVNGAIAEVALATVLVGSIATGAVNVYPLGPLTPGAVFSPVTLAGPAGASVLILYDVSYQVLSTQAVVAGSSYLAPPGAAFWSLQLTGSVAAVYTGSFTVVSPTPLVPSVTLMRNDDTGLNYYEPGYLQESALTPSQYNIASVVPLTLQVAVYPTAIATLPESGYDLIVLESGGVFAPPTPSLLNVPDDLAWVLKWGALADLLGRESEATDLPRAAFCRARYIEGLKLMQATPWIMQAQINSVPADLASFTEMDTYRPEWDSGAPDYQAVITAGMDLFTVVPDPQTSLNMAMTVLGNAPVPVADGDYIQCSRDVWDSILDYAQFLAMFKQGGAEFAAAQGLERGFYAAAMATNGRLQKLGLFADVFTQEGGREVREQERFAAAK